MPKQGQFAQSHRQKISRSIKQRYQVKRQRTINPTMVNDFMIVRYQLTTGKSLKRADRESGQRFLQELMPRLQASHFDLQTAVKQTLVAVNARVPWQFFYQLSQNWPSLERFLHRELPALPLAQQVIVKHPVSQTILDQKIAGLLARRVMGMTLINKSVDVTTKQALTNQMLHSIMPDQKIRWSAVQTLLAPWPFPIAEELDEGTKDWLKTIRQLQI